MDKTSHKEKLTTRIFETILEIIEDKPNYKLPLIFYYFLIMIYFF